LQLRRKAEFHEKRPGRMTREKTPQLYSDGTHQVRDVHKFEITHNGNNEEMGPSKKGEYDEYGNES
jgi:hypothetical protein